MKSTIVAPIVALSAVAVAGPIFGPRAAQSYSLAAYTPPAYAPPPAYSYPSSFATGSKYTTSTTITFQTGASVSISPATPSSNSSLGSPVGFSNTTSVPLSTGVTTTYLPLTTAFTVTLFTKSSSTVSLSPLYSFNYTTPGSSGSSIGSPVTASTGTAPLHTNSTSIRTITSTSYVTVPFPTPSLSFTSAPRNGTYLPSGTVYSTGSTPSLSFTSAPRNGTYLPSGTVYSTGSTPVSPVTASRNTTSSTFVYSTGTVPTTSYGTAPVPYSYSMALSTGITSSTGSREGSPVTAGNSTATTATATGTGYTPVITYTSSSISTAYPNSTEGSPITGSASSTFDPTFNSESRLPGTGSSTSSVTNLETFPSIIPDSTTSSATSTPSSGFGTITTAPTLVPYATNTPYAYPLTTAYEYGGPGSYPAYGDVTGGSWFERLFRRN